VTDDQTYLMHIRDALTRVFDYTRDGHEDFVADPRTQDAVLRKLEIIGEAVKHLSAALRADNDDIPWRQIAGMRDMLIHDYFGVDLELVWNVVERDLPALKLRVDELLQ